jgi:TatD DNase family protein
MSYFDSHCHLTDPRFAGDVGLVAERARAAGVQRFVIIASNEDDASAGRRLALELDVWSTAGIHPHEANRCRDGFDRVRQLAADPRVVAIGETGLDYHYDNAPRAVQRDAFERHVDLAAETGKPVVVHSREANEDTIAVIRAAPPGVNGVLHCFAGSHALFEAAMEADWYVSFSGLLTFPGYGTAELAAEVPGERLLIETDAPYLAPVPHRGGRNEPAYVVEVARAVAELRDEPLDRVATITTRNANHFYGLD